MLPAADPSAAPGTCGSAIADVPQSTENGAMLTRTNIGEMTLGDVGTRGDDTTTEPLEVAGRVLVAQLVIQPRSDQSGFVTLDPDLDSRAEYAVTYGGRVVGVQRAVSTAASALSTSAYWADPADGAIAGFATTTSLAFDACGPAPSGERGPLPNGRYELYALDPGTTSGTGTASPSVLGGPWALELEDALPQVTGLPEEFPTEEVPVVGDSVYDVFELDGVAASGWVLQTRTDAVNAVDAAAQTLVDAGGTISGISIAASESGTAGLSSTTSEVQTEHWTVQLSMRTAKDGSPLLRYRLEPR
ncbi:hypothetical protein [Cellulomonas soli]